MIGEWSVIVVEDDLVVADLEGEAVVMNLDIGHYYGLNKIGARVLELAKQPTPVREIVVALQHQYDVEPERLTRDVLAFLHTMEEKNLIREKETTLQQ